MESYILNDMEYDFKPLVIFFNPTVIFFPSSVL